MPAIQWLPGERGLNVDLEQHLTTEYDQALNISFLTKEGGTTLSIELVNGNDYAFDIGAVVAQNKIFRIYISTTGSYDLDALKTDKGTTYFTIAPFTDQSSAVLNINAGVILAGLTANITPGSGYVDVEITSDPYYEWYLNSTGIDELQIDVIQEAIDPSLAGNNIPIESEQIANDLFIMSTPQERMPVELEIVNISNSVGLILVSTNTNHNLVNGQSVKITGAPANTGANGFWNVTVVTPTDFTLVQSTFTNTGTSGIVTVDYTGVGEIGVATYSRQTDLWTYTRLLRSKEFNFRTQKQIDAVGLRPSSNSIEIDYTDDYNVPRTFSYEGPYIQDGALNYISSLNIYDYGSIAVESILIQGGINVEFSFIQQIQSGGNITSGNKRYTVRFITPSGARTEIANLSNPINVYSENSANTLLITGDNPQISTGKINEFQFSGINPDLYEFAEVIVVEDIAGVTTASIIGRFPVVSSVLLVQHTGNETATTILDISELFRENFRVSKAKNITIIDNRLVLSNLEIDELIDLSTWAQTFQHNLERALITDQGGANSNSGTVQDFAFGGYADPYVVNTQVGYMLNETDRFHVVGITKDGKRTLPFWIDDIIFNTNPVNTANPFGDNRRITPLPDFDLTDDPGGTYPANYDFNATVDFTPTAYVFYPQFTGINFDFVLPDGRTVREVLDRIEFWRAENIPEVLAGGVIVTRRDRTIPGVVTESGFQFPYQNAVNAVYGNYGYTEQGMFIAPDSVIGGGSLAFINGAVLQILGGVPRGHELEGTTNSKVFETFGTCQTLLDNGTGLPIPTQIQLEALENIGIGGYGATTLLDFPQIPTWLNAPSCLVNTVYPFPAFLVLEAMPPIYAWRGSNPQQFDYTNVSDRGDIYAQYYRPLTNKYGDINTGVAIPTNSGYDISPSTTTTDTFDVFGGYCFTQKSFIRLGTKTAAAFDGPDPMPPQDVFGVTYGFFSQNRINSQMRNRDDDESTNGLLMYPANLGGTTALTVLDAFNLVDSIEYFSYSDSYTIKANIVDAAPVFNENLDYNVDYPTRIIWSDLRPNGSLINYFRQFPPLNFIDLDLAYGEINDSENINGELFTLQPDKFQLQYFNTSGLLATNPGQVVMGNTGVLSRRGTTITSLGSMHKNSGVKGVSQGGNDIYYFVDWRRKVIVRFGADGAVPISEIKGMDSFFNNYLDWVRDYDMPAAGLGICGVWNHRYKDVIWTIKGYKQTGGWTNGQVYGEGAEVNLGDYDYTGGVPIIYVSKVFHIANTNNRPGTGANWESVWTKIALDNKAYYNVYTVVFSEIKNKFTTFLSMLPNIYMEYDNGYLTGKPVNSKNRIYQHNRGELATWYQEGETEQSEDGYLRFYVNAEPNLSKVYTAVQSHSSLIPYKVEFTTLQHQSTQFASDFETRDGIDVHYAPVKNDELQTGSNEDDTTQLFGTFMRVKFFFEKKVPQKFMDFTCKVLGNFRPPDK